MSAGVAVIPESSRVIIGASPTRDLTFAGATIEEIAAAPKSRLDDLPFGIIGLASDGTVELYSAAESRMAGLSADRVLGKHFFTAVAPCMNNFMVAHRFEEEAELDNVIDYVLTLRMRPTPVKMRLLKSAGTRSRYLLIQR